MESFLLRLWDVGHNEGFWDHQGIKENLNENQTHFFSTFADIYVNYLLWKKQKYVKSYIFVYFKFHIGKFVQPCMHNELG